MRTGENLGTKRKMNFQEEALNLEKKKIQIMEERLRKKSQADEDEDCMFLMSLLPSIKKLNDIQTLELRMDFLSSITRRLQISKNLSRPVNIVPTASHISCPLLHKQQVSSRHVLGIQTLQRIHSVYVKHRFTTTLISSPILKTSKGASLL
jgi:hypothetical protein